MAGRFDIVTSLAGSLNRRKIIKLLVAIVAALLLLTLRPFGTIAAGERGVHLRFGAVTGTVHGEGLYFLIPLIDSVQVMDIKIQKEETKADAASKDLQTVHSTVALNFHIDPDQVARIYQGVGMQFKERIIDPAMQEAIKGSTAKFTAEELITKREEVREDIKSPFINLTK